MTAPSALRRAGDDRPHRRPASAGRLAMRAALLAMLVPLTASLGVGSALALEPTPPPIPVLIGPGPAVPPSPPELPRSKPGAKARSDPAGGRGGDRRDRGGDRRDRGTNQRDALELRGSCSPFRHVQTYTTWGPAVSYGRPVTVVYQAERCSTPDGAALDLLAEGTATIYDGPVDGGTVLETRPFVVSGTWRHPKNPDAWPPTWWACGVPYASYVWEIPGVYSFQVSARGGLWTLSVTGGVDADAFEWSHDGCA